MKYFLLLAVLLTTVADARTRSFFRTEEEYAQKVINKKQFKIAGKYAGVIQEYNGAKLAVFKDGNGMTAAYVNGLQSLMVHAIGEDFAYALFYDPSSKLPSTVSNDLSGYLNSSDIRSMKFGPVGKLGTSAKIGRILEKHTEVLLTIFSTDSEGFKGATPIINACDNKVQERTSSDRHKTVAISFNQDCQITIKKNKDQALNYFLITNNLAPVVRELIQETRAIISNLKRKISAESKKSTPDKKKIESYNKSMVSERRELRQLKQFLQRIDEE